MPYMVCQEYKSLVTAEVNTTIFAVYFWSQIFRRAKKVVITPADTGPCYTTFSVYRVTVKHHHDYENYGKKLNKHKKTIIF